MPLENYNCVLYGPLLEAHHMFVSLATLQMEKLCIYLRCVIFITFLDSFFVHIFISMYSQYIHVAAMVEIINSFSKSLFFAVDKVYMTNIILRLIKYRKYDMIIYHISYVSKLYYFLLAELR